MSEFTTGEAVVLQLPIARVPTRAAAFLIDLLLQAVLAVLLGLGLAFAVFANGLDSAWYDVVVLVCVVSVLVGYPVAWETLAGGRTLGKLALGLRVVRADGGPVDFRHALARGLGGAVVDFWMLGGFGIIAVLTSMCSPQARRIGDVLAGTVVVHERQPLPRPALVNPPPPWVVDWALRLDPAPLPDDLARSTRRYLTRLNTLTPQAQHELGVALVNSVCVALRTQPPNYPPSQVLWAVIAERQRRELPARPALAAPYLGAVAAPH